MHLQELFVKAAVITAGLAAAWIVSVRFRVAVRTALGLLLIMLTLLLVLQCA